MKKKILMLLLAASLSAMAFTGCGTSGKNGADGSAAITAEADANGNYAFNGDFEEIELEGWTINNIDGVTDEVNLYTRETDCYSGIQCLHFYSEKDVNFTVEQKLTGLESGTYKLTGSVQGDAVGDSNSSVYLYAVVDGETIKGETSLDGYLTWNLAEIEGIEISKGEITIGWSVTNAPGGWGTIDDIKLVKE